MSGAMTQTDMAETLGEILKIDPTFSKEEFVQQCKYEIIPSVLESFMQGNKHVLKDWCHETVGRGSSHVTDHVTALHAGIQHPVGHH